MAFIIPSHFRNVPNNFLIRLLGLKPWLKSITLGSDFFHLAKVFATANSDQGLALHLEHRFLTSSHALLVMKSVCFAKEIPAFIMHGSKWGTGGPDPTPISGRSKLYSFLLVYGSRPLQTHSYQASIQCWAIIG